MCVALAVVSLTLYRKVLRLWWTYDDAFHLRQAFTHSTASILTDHAFWQQLPNPVFTPLLFISLKFDLARFGVDAYSHYLHHLVLIVLVALAVYFVCRLWVGPPRAVAAAALMVAGPPMCEIAAQLFHRHYVEGLILSLVSVALVVIAFRRQRWPWSIASAVLYLAAMAEKEVYVPLPLVALAIPESTLKVRMKYLAPHAVALALYALWRTAMLGVALSGYGLTTASGGWTRSLATLPARVLRRLGGADPVLGSLFVIALAGVILVIVVRKPRSRLILVAGLVASLGPILPVASQIETRFVLTTWTLAAIACAFLPSRSRWIPIPVLLVIGLALVANRAEWATTYRAMSRMSDEGRFYMAMTGDAILRNPVIPPAALGELAWVRKQMNAPPGGRASYDDLSHCQSNGDGELFEYREPLRRVVRVRKSFVERTVCQNIRDDLPLDARFSYRDDVLYWNLGPHRQGRYRFVLGHGAQAFDVPAEAGFRLPKVPGMTLRIRYESPAGWITYSPELALDFARRPDVTWRR